MVRPKVKEPLETICVRIPPALRDAFRNYVETFNQAQHATTGVPHEIDISTAYRTALERGLAGLLRALELDAGGTAKATRRGAPSAFDYLYGMPRLTQGEADALRRRHRVARTTKRKGGAR